MAVVVVTDTTQYWPSELLAEHDIAVVSLYVNEGDTQTRESDLRRPRRVLRAPGRNVLAADNVARRSATSSPHTSRSPRPDTTSSASISGDLSGTAEGAPGRRS
jgi:hypothetical protein